MNWIEIPLQHFQDIKGIRRVRIRGKTICLIPYGGKIYATSARCPHAGADLAGGWCEEGRLICPRHRHAFDLENGRGDPGQGNYISTYPLRQEKDKWFIGMKDPWYRKWFLFFI